MDAVRKTIMLAVRYTRLLTTIENVIGNQYTVRKTRIARHG